MNRQIMMFRRSVLLHATKSMRSYYTVKSPSSNKHQDVIVKHIYSQIKISGPITVADYMKQVLIHPMGGYYMHKDMFGEGGDFVTSPELGQIFGEMVAIWFINEWSKVASPKPFRIVELGPGRGSLCQDLLRIFKHFNALQGANIDLVEVSDLLSDLQSRKLCIKSTTVSDPASHFYREGQSFDGVPVRWYRNLQDVPRGEFTLLVAHEFFDALPIHKFQKTERGYREILIDIQPETEEQIFRYVLAREETPALKLFGKEHGNREHFEISPETLVLIRGITERLESDGGLALIADYGHLGEGTDTFRAFKKHNQHEPLVEPGTADLTADVDFSLIKKAVLAEGGVIAFGPTTQREFLLRMGIEHRMKKLEEGANEEQKRNLLDGYHMMTDNDKMGNRFKFLALLPAVLESLLKKVPVVGFH